LKILSRCWAHFSEIKKKVGFISACQYAIKRLRSKGLTPTSIAVKRDIIGFYDFIYIAPFGTTNNKDSSAVINWIIPDFGIGSGGHLNIFRVVKKLEEKGFVCRINIDGATHFSTGHEARKCIRENFFPIDAEVSIGRDELMPASATFATGWTTAYTVRDFVGSGKKYYFVQDFEPFFSAPGSDYIFAEETYKFGFKGITAGNWLADKLSTEYAMETVPFNFSYDRELYKSHLRREPEKKRVFFYARPVTSRRAFELGLLALAIIHKKNPAIEFILAGWDLSGYEIPFPYLNCGVLSLNELPDLYSQCDVALILSFTNLSLLPLETMACNCAVVSNKGANVEWLLDEDVVMFSEPSPEAISTTIVDLIVDDEKLSLLKKKGLEFAALTNWNNEVNKIADEISKDLKI
jgi:glycosyltransferase involved in cell wall biosynthesis